MVKLVLQNTKNDSLAEQAQNCDIFTLDLLKNNNGTEVLSILFHFLFTPNISEKKNFTYGTLRNKRRKSRISDHFQTFFRPEEEKIKE